MLMDGGMRRKGTAKGRERVLYTPRDGGPMHDVSQTVIDEVRGRLTRGFPQQVRACLDALTDEQVWWRPNAGSNSVGNLVLHLCGSTRHFLGRAVGGTDYRRDRPAEFAEKGPLPKEALRALL